MSFISYGFAAFLLVSFILYYVIPKKMQWCFLLIISALFYMCTGVEYFLFILFTGITVYKTAVVLSKVPADKQNLRKKIFLLGIGVNLLIFVFLKYVNFAIENVNLVFGVTGSENTLELIDIVLPLGLSYYTLQAIGYLTDVYRGKYEAEKNPGKLLLFLSFFPQLIQGPISQFDELKQTLFSEHEISSVQIKRGAQRMLWGYFKKLVIANRVLPVVLAVGGNPAELGGVYTLIGMLAYTVQLYGDFTGGIDMAIGCAQMFDVTLPENFDRPFASTSLAEYWRRWHMSLMKWFREYVFYPLSVSGFAGNLMKCGKKFLSRKKAAKLPVYFASLVTWFLTGIWHGASWRFVVWGLINCVIILVSQELTPVYRKFHKKYAFSNGKAYHYFAVLRTLCIVSIVQMTDYYDSLTEGFLALVMMIPTFHLSELFGDKFALLGITGADVVILLIGICLFCLVSFWKGKGILWERLEGFNAVSRYMIWAGLLLVTLILGVYGQGYDAGQFIYNQY